MKPLDFRVAGYFPVSINIVGGLLVFVSLFTVTMSLIITFILLALALVIFTTHYRLCIDPVTKTFHDYVWVLGFKHGEKGRFQAIQYLFIKKSRATQTVSSRVSSATFTKELFDGYLKFSEEHKIHLKTTENKSRLISLLKKIASQLQVNVIDYSDGEPQAV